MKELTEAEVKKILTLSALSPEREDISSFTKEFNKVLELFNQLEKVDTSSVSELAYIQNLTNVFREDIVETSMPSQTINTLAPESEGTYIAVPVFIDS
jgi:aspartyl-tRNA(Asn)/glutamyl-tRNA(Gln) amidotransferase subunit C